MQQNRTNWKAGDTLTFCIFDLLLLPPHNHPFLHPPWPLLLWGWDWETYSISSTLTGYACVGACVIACLYTLLKAAWVVKDCDSLQVALDKEWTTKAAVETIFSHSPSLGALWAGRQQPVRWRSISLQGHKISCISNSHILHQQSTEEEEMRESEENLAGFLLYSSVAD